MRYLKNSILKDLEKKMVFISGPRQSGKTTFVQDLIKFKEAVYLNWDDIDDRKKILKRDWVDEEKIIVFDEIHKFSRWKNFIKGTYDTQKEKHQFIITGSAKLDIYKKGQDSMVGRFFSWRLHPLCLAEIKNDFQIEGSDNENLIHRLIEFGGFPEPFFSKDLQFTKRWRKERINLIFRQDIQELESIRDISLLEVFYFQLTSRVSSEVVLSNIARDIEIAPKTAKAWLNVLEKTYTLFSITPYSKNLAKAVVKAPKIYFYDNAEVDGDIGAKFENLVASHLLKRLHYLEDFYGDKYELNYIRDQNGHEIDFLILKNRKPVLLIEAKVSDETRSKSLYYFMDKLKIKSAVQLVLNGKKASTKDGILVVDAQEWLSQKLESQLFGQ